MAPLAAVDPMASALAACDTMASALSAEGFPGGAADPRAFAAVFEEQNLTTATIMARLEAARKEGAALREAAQRDDDAHGDYAIGGGGGISDEYGGAADGARDSALKEDGDPSSPAPPSDAADDVASSLRRQCAELRAYVALLEGDMELKKLECARAKAQAAKCVLMMQTMVDVTDVRGGDGSLVDELRSMAAICAFDADVEDVFTLGVIFQRDAVSPRIDLHVSSDSFSDAASTDSVRSPQNPSAKPEAAKPEASWWRWRSAEHAEQTHELLL
ncbi:hypothetical protein M885DRAFT_518552 [Pelagophyceae sp. CCMP2097]|nr:hypothetical protein M885DRAFT_518552 [Pelagophyceae sp. CCMP2097]